MPQMPQGELSKILWEVRDFISGKKVGFICYIWEKDNKYGAGCASADADSADAMVAIEKILGRFGIDFNTLISAVEQHGN